MRLFSVTSSTGSRTRARALDERRLIDRDAVFRLKRAAFDRLFSWWTAHAEQDSRAAFSAFCAEHGTDLRLFATYCALAERHGGGWQAWPPELPLPDLGPCRALRS